MIIILAAFGTIGFGAAIPKASPFSLSTASVSVSPVSNSENTHFDTLLSARGRAQRRGVIAKRTDGTTIGLIIGGVAAVLLVFFAAVVAPCRD
jgi:hypothetical protein